MMYAHDNPGSICRIKFQFLVWYSMIYAPDDDFFPVREFFFDFRGLGLLAWFIRDYYVTRHGRRGVLCMAHV